MDHAVSHGSRATSTSTTTRTSTQRSSTSRAGTSSSLPLPSVLSTTCETYLSGIQILDPTSGSITTWSTLPTGRGYIVKVEEHDDTDYPLVRLQYFAEEAARDDVNFENFENNDIKSDFNKVLQYFRQFLRLQLSVGRLCDDWRRRPIQGTLHFVQRHEQDLKD
eukprot:1771210-Amphidinium_carterae.2